MRRIAIRVATCIAALIAAIAAWLAWQWLPPRPKLVVSRETTWIVEPLLPDGTVDYEAAWRNERSAGVTPENNAAPFLFATLGFDPSRFSDAERAALPQPFARFSAYFEWYYDHEASLPENLRDRYTDAPPLVEALELGEADASAVRLAALWLDAESACLDEIERFVKRDHMVASGLFHDPSNAWGMFEIHHALRARAALAAAKGDDDAAFAHLASGLRLARLQRSLGITAHLLAAEAGEAAIWTSALQLARRAGRVSSGAFRDLLESADPSGAEARLRARVTAERMHTLDFLVHPVPLPLSLFGRAEPTFLDRLISRIDPNRACRRFNEAADRVESALCTGDWADRFGRVDELNRRYREVEARVGRGTTYLWTICRRDTFGDVIVDILFWPLSSYALGTTFAPFLQSERALVELAALTYSTETGHDSKSSNDLTPLLFAMPWRDRAIGYAVEFERQADGTLVARGPLVDLQKRLEEWMKKPIPKPAH